MDAYHQELQDRFLELCEELDDIDLSPDERLSKEAEMWDIECEFDSMGLYLEKSRKTAPKCE